MQVQALGYVGIGASDLRDWTDFATNWLGMQMVERGNACRAFRMDDRSQRLVVDRSLAEGERYFGFEVADAAALDALAARLEATHSGAARAVFARGSALRAWLISFADPGGTGWRRSGVPRWLTNRFVPADRSPASGRDHWAWVTPYST